MFQVPPPIVHNEQSTSTSKIDSSLLAGQCPPSFVPPTHRPAVRRRSAGTALIALTALVMTSCTDPPPTATPSAAPSLVAPSTQVPSTQSADPKTAALNAYSGLLQAYAKAGLTANPDEPDLAAHADGSALKVLRDALAGFKDKGEIFKGEYKSAPTVAAVSPTDSPTSVVVADCLDTKKQLVYKATGELADDEPGGRRSTAATVRRQGGTWKVVNLDVREKGTC
jgi:hypothetical protein